MRHPNRPAIEPRVTNSLRSSASPSTARILWLAVGLLTLPLVISPCVAGPGEAESSSDLQVLFIGNSFTYYHDLPRMVAELAKAGRQVPLRFHTETPGGCTLEKHWQDGKALARIKSRSWDFVILQDQSQAPLLQRESMIIFGKRFDAEIKMQGAETILYLTWARQTEPENQPLISQAYARLSKDLNARLAPVGNAWSLALQADRRLVLHDSDGIHPNAKGTYLAACVFYATIYGVSPEGLPGRMGGLTDHEARILQEIAWQAVQQAKD